VLLWFFCFSAMVQLKPLKRAPVLITFGVITFVWLLRLIRPEFLQRLELMTYDMRVRAALRSAPTVATNLGFVYINEDSVRSLWDGSVGFHVGLYWPRQVYGRLVHELAAQGAKAVALDVLMGELRPDHGSVDMVDGGFRSSDELFAWEMQQASNVIVAITKEVIPPPLFLTNAAAAGDITTDKDADGILRRVQVFRSYTNWHQAFRQAADEYNLELEKAYFQGNKLIVPGREGGEIKATIDKDGNFDVGDFVGDKIPTGMRRFSKPFTIERAWHMGVVVAARELGLDLASAEEDLPNGEIRLHGSNGVQRVIPVDRNGYFFVDWCLPPDDTRLTIESFHHLLGQYKERADGKSNGLTNRWRGKLAIVGSSAIVGNNLTDRGATPLSQDALLVSKHWNVANSVILGRFVQQSSIGVDLLLIALVGVAAGFLIWQFRVLPGTILVLSLMAAYIAIAWGVYVQTRYWIPVVLPVWCGALLNYIGLMAWQVIFEQAENRRITATFGNVVSKPILQMLLNSPTEKLALGGKRREITVMFADIRGFTEFTDVSQARAAEEVERKQLAGAAAEARYDENARETLENINEYLGLVADTVIRHNATLDKFIGDCVMAFWGAPVANPRHAVDCVRAAIASQRAIHALNMQRPELNRKKELENAARASAGLEPVPLLPSLQLGSGINTGMAVAGYMGSASETKSYTVFGREVNVASRLEGLSGRGRIFISETTYSHLLRDDPALAATCVEQEPQKVKGVSKPVKVYEVPWREPEAAPSPPSHSSGQEPLPATAAA
jgi:class 3 adenylate cyclase/CHASE2 domain-containing sensor protein